VASAACPRTAAQADAHVDGELSPSAAAALDAHLRACPPCRAYVHALRGLLAAVGRQRDRQPAAPASLRARVRALAARWREDADADGGR
jgi:anti-sigma factor RsiW